MGTDSLACPPSKPFTVFYRVSFKIFFGSQSSLKSRDDLAKVQGRGRSFSLRVGTVPLGMRLQGVGTAGARVALRAVGAGAGTPPCRRGREAPGRRPAFKLHPRPPPSLRQRLRGPRGGGGGSPRPARPRLVPRAGGDPGSPAPLAWRPAAAEPYGRCRRRSPAAPPSPPGAAAAAAGPRRGGFLAKPWRGRPGAVVGGQRPGCQSAGQAGSCSPALGAFRSRGGCGEGGKPTGHALFFA